METLGQLTLIRVELSIPNLFSCGNIRKAVERLLFKTIEIRSESVPMALEQAHETHETYFQSSPRFSDNSF